MLDAVSQAEKYSELSDSDTGILLKNYAKQRNYGKELLASALPGITGPTAKKLIEWKIIEKDYYVTLALRELPPG